MRAPWAAWRGARRQGRRHAPSWPRAPPAPVKLDIRGCIERTKVTLMIRSTRQKRTTTKTAPPRCRPPERSAAGRAAGRPAASCGRPTRKRNEGLCESFPDIAKAGCRSHVAASARHLAMARQHLRASTLLPQLHRSCATNVAMPQAPEHVQALSSE